MDQVSNIAIPTDKIYTDRAIYVGTFLGGPLVAGYLMAENFKAFDEADKARKTWIYTIMATIVIFGCVLLIPENIKIPNQVIPLIYLLVVYYLVKHFQGQRISEHIDSGGPIYKWWRTAMVALIGLIVSVIVIFGLLFLSGGLEDTSTASKTYGTMKHEIAFDKNNISEKEVDEIAHALAETTFFDEAVTKYVYAKKVNDQYEISISVVEGIENNSEALQWFTDLRADLQTLFPRNKIIVKLIVNDLDHVVKTLE